VTLRRPETTLSPHSSCRPHGVCAGLLTCYQRIAHRHEGLARPPVKNRVTSWLRPLIAAGWFSRSAAAAARSRSRPVRSIVATLKARGFAGSRVAAGHRDGGSEVSGKLASAGRFQCQGDQALLAQIDPSTFQQGSRPRPTWCNRPRSDRAKSIHRSGVGAGAARLRTRDIAV
jgi:hypothetical protein